MKYYLIISSFLGFLGVAAGAFGAHALKSRLSLDMLNVFETGVRYQMYHVFAMMAAVWLQSPWAAGLFLAGILLFSGSLYALSMTSIRLFGFVTPIGGVLLLAGWLTLFTKTFNQS